MAGRPPGPSPERWAHAWRIEEDPSARLRRLRRLRLGTAVGSVVAGVLVILLLIGPFPVTTAVPTVLAYVFVGYLFTMAPATWFGLGWAIQRTPDRVAFDDDGLLIHQVGGQETEMPWSNPDFAVDLTNWDGSDFTHGLVVLTSRMKNRMPEANLTIEGTGALRSEALGRGLHVEERVEGKPPRAFGILELRRAPPVTAPGSVADDGASAESTAS